MITRQPYYRGCLLGLAVGDALGFAVDERSLTEILEGYGPNGLEGYDEVNGYTSITSYTQLAALACNGLLLGQTHGQLRGQMAPYVRYVRLAEREWAQSQRRSPAGKRFCWISRVPELQTRRCMENRMVDLLIREEQGSMEEPLNRFDTPGAIGVAAAVGMFYQTGRISREENNRLGAEAVALTHGSPQAFLTGAALTHLISRTVRDGEKNLPVLIRETASALNSQFSREYPQVWGICTLMAKALELAENPAVSPREAMETLGCRTMPEVLAGALYACLTCNERFEAGITTAVNHSGRSAAVGVAAGAILGAILGERAIPEDFYLLPLEPAEVLRELADDMFRGCPMDQNSRLYDDDWDRKYIHCAGN